MVRGVSNKQIDESLFEIPQYWGKVFMYNSPSWNVLFPIVDIIRLFPKNTIIAHTYAKNQNTIKLYGSQYNHSVIGVDLKRKDDYLKNLKTVKFVFIFSDTSDTLASNLINYCETTKTPLICYSSFDKIYHFYEYIKDTKKTTQIKEPESVILKIESTQESIKLTKLDSLFPEFHVLEPDQALESTLDKCIEILKDTSEKEEKKKVYSAKIPFDANFNKLKYLEKSKKPVVYDDELPVTKPLKNLSQFFKKRS
jgi:hypothetical protein